MGFFGYYAFHSFVNQLRKLFKTWVLVFFAVCMLIGGLIGVFAATLEDTIQQEQEPAQVQQLPEPEPADESEDRGPSAELMELIAGGAVLALFFFEAVSADKNGSKIFLPADVNLLFPSPMRPQSVLLFRLATQLGTALIATIYILFQLPNLMFNLGLSGWAAVAILITWFCALFIGKLIQVMLYTLCSTRIRFKQLLSKCIYGFGIALAGAFLIWFRSSGLDILTAAMRFFNAPVTRWIPFWGWLKTLAADVAKQDWTHAGISLVLCIAGSAALLFAIWHMDADFYEDAMAKSEETAAMMEKMRSEKTSGAAVTRQRKKERKDSLRRDGLNHGQGASVFFHKTLYNRFRFSHLGFLTKTMETYFAAALGTAAFLRFYFDSRNPLPVVFVLGGLAFFRAMGDPLAEDTGMDFFRLIPDSTWKKLLCSLLGGTVCCLMDLLLPMLAASALLTVNPMKLLMWLPLMVSLDFYATSVVSFIDLSVPASIGKTIKQVITILFIYFGLLPDIVILAFGVALGHTLSAAIGSTLVNLALGTAAFSMASVFLEPKGKDYTAAKENQDFRRARRAFSRMGVGILLFPVVTTLGQLGLFFAAQRFFPGAADGGWGFWLLTFAPQYLVAIPVCLLVFRRVPAVRPEKHPLGAARGVKFFFISLFAMGTGILLSLITTGIAGRLIGSAPTNALEQVLSGDNLAAQALFAAVLAPIAEEFLFRRQLIDRLRTYGGRTAVILSALFFALCHGNFFQFFYAFGLGLIFGYIYLNTGRLRCTVIAHMAINLVGSVLIPEAAAHMSDGSANAAVWSGIYMGYLGLLVVGGITGLVLLFMNYRALHYPAGALELPKGKRFAVSCLNPGMIAAFLLGTVLLAASLFS